MKKYGAGKWRFIQKDPALGKILNQRSNVDLKVRAPNHPRDLPFPPPTTTRHAKSEGCRDTTRPPTSPTAQLPTLTEPAPTSHSQDKWRNMYPGHSTADPTPDSVRSRPTTRRAERRFPM